MTGDTTANHNGTDNIPPAKNTASEIEETLVRDETEQKQLYNWTLHGNVLKNSLRTEKKLCTTVWIAKMAEKKDGVFQKSKLIQLLRVNWTEENSKNPPVFSKYTTFTTFKFK